MRYSKLLPVTMFGLVLTCAGFAPAVPAEDEVVDQAIDELVAEHNAKVDDPQLKVVCKKEAQVGTRIKETVCRTVRREMQDATDAKGFVDRVRGYPRCSGGVNC